MKTLYAILAGLTLLAGCSKSATISSKNYSGQFILADTSDIPYSGRIHVSFSGVNFSGSADSSILPYIGSGVFKLNGDSIYFTQTGLVPDLFGRGSILEGGFRLTRNDDSLTFYRKGVGSQGVYYRLRRE